jgi:hypothetical protein
LRYEFGLKEKVWWGIKIGERPSFGPPIPARVISLVGGDREMFLKGARCESQDLGIAAFTYYRRVVENQKGRIFSEIIKVCKRLKADQALIVELEAASKETQFSKAVDRIKHGLPDSLLLHGCHNPLSLLHDALSGGVHERTDEECLGIATAVKLILFELAERMAAALKDEAALTSAIDKLLNKKTN